MTKYLLDTGPLVAFLNAAEPRRTRQWAIATLGHVAKPLYSCEPVITEAAHFLGNSRPVLEMVESGDLVIAFELRSQAGEVNRIIDQFADRQVDLADACLVRMSELFPDSQVITLDATDFRVYRRNGSEAVPFISPPRT